jgi:hypothetical protein
MTKKKWDVIFIDVSTPTPYEHATLETRAIGGTEATVIRVAEALGFLGLKVAVFEHNLTMPLMGSNAYYLPITELDNADPKAVVMLRGCQFAEKFPNAVKVSLHQDDPTDERLRPMLLGMRDSFIDHNIHVIGASKWHADALKELLYDREKQDNPRIGYIYNPVPDHLYVAPSQEIKYNSDKLVWPASPHKGLNKAVELMERLVEVSGNKNLRLHTFNPGYFQDNKYDSQYVIEHGPVRPAELWQHMSESLCVFYPTSFKETFGCMAAEANAVHTPVLCHEIAALAETVCGHGQFVKQDPKSIIDTTIRWNRGERPKIYGQERFRLSEVVPRWIKVLSRLI